MLIVLNKPYGVVSQFTPNARGQRTLDEFGLPPGVYPLGRLDMDSEGMLLLTDETRMNSLLLDPNQAHWRRYWAQLDGEVTDEAIERLESGICIGDYTSLPAHVARLESEPDLPPRHPPVRFRKSIPTSWIAIELREGKNRQVRRMTAAAGFPTLRLIRVRIGDFEIPRTLAPCQWRKLGVAERRLVFAGGSEF